MNKYILYYLLCSENPKDNLITIGDKKVDILSTVLNERVIYIA